MSLDLAKTRALHHWVFLRPLSPNLERGEGLVLPESIKDKNVVSEGVATVVSAGPGKWHEEAGEFTPHGLKAGDTVLYRGFLRFAHQVGDLFGKENLTDVFVLSADDVLAVVEGPGTLGLYDEYEL